MNWYKKAKTWSDRIDGGKADNKTPDSFNRKDLEKGKNIEFEQNNNLKMENSLEDDTKDARGLYHQRQGDESRHQPDAFGDVLLDNELLEGEHVSKLSNLARSYSWTEFNRYIQKLKAEGFDQNRINSIVTRATSGIKF